ncbi:MAG: hypothetical protein MZU95_10430 [Desulfomicrobium escambiense]|nr:hypothetical protein [Desulfomicrobium escambiense]
MRDAAGAARAKQRGAESIGLVRSEFIEPPDGRQPDAAFYKEAFGALLAAAHPLVVTLRLLDIAADKRPAWLPEGHDCGPLGRQGVRLFDTDPVRGVVAAQLAALAKLNAPERLRLLLPYITTAAEAKRWHKEIRAELDVPIGVMIETLAAALDIGALLDAADFAALGTNDLMQCLFAADRDQPALRGYLDAYAPLLYRFLADVARAAGARLPELQVSRPAAAAAGRAAGAARARLPGVLGGCGVPPASRRRRYSAPGSTRPAPWPRTCAGRRGAGKCGAGYGRWCKRWGGGWGIAGEGTRIDCPSPRQWTYSAHVARARSFSALPRRSLRNENGSLAPARGGGFRYRQNSV